jgi:hypothetical protein
VIGQVKNTSQKLKNTSKKQHETAGWEEPCVY